MHTSALDKMQAFVDGYLCEARDQPLAILDVGSRVAEQDALTHRAMMSIDGWRYTGMDIAPGENVDVVVQDPYCWSELDDAAFDVVICGQVFEHIEYFWITALEIARVMKTGGLCCITAPSAGHVHRYPSDCWRFYPDGLPAVMKYAGLAALESYVARPGLPLSPGADVWRDACVVARKPERTPEQSRAFELRTRLNRLLLKPDLSARDLQDVVDRTPTEDVSTITVDGNRDVFGKLEAANISRFGARRLKRRVVANHLRAAWRAVRRPLGA